MKMLDMKHVSGGYGDKLIVKDIHLQVMKGERIGILGPNGSGKTTLLKLISGELPVKQGEIRIQQTLLSQFRLKELAKVLAVLPQHMEALFPYRVEETVKLGRYAHQSGWFPSWSQQDEQAVIESLQDTQLLHLKDRLLSTLSGGERQRVFLARALAQQPQMLLLDEPANHLDITHQIKFFDTLTDLTETRMLTLIATFHDINLASLYCDRILLMKNGRPVQIGTPNEVLDEQVLSALYDTPLIKIVHPTTSRPLITFSPKR